MATFIGEYMSKVDVKGRIILPLAFKRQLPADAQDRLVVKKDIFVNCLVLYSLEDWNLQMEMISRNMNPYISEHNMFQRNFFKGTAELSLDNNNRFLVPKRLLDLIGAKRDIVLAGQNRRIEIWDEETYRNIDISSVDIANLAEKLLGKSLN